MGRIRTIKPEFFTHEELFEAEESEGLPLRLAFAGLWTQCDREGRFRWQPRRLKLACLPYDDVDFSRVLDALAARGFIKKYASESGELFGFVPSWHKNQVINNRETESTLPNPEDCLLEPVLTCGPRVNLASTTPLCNAQGEGKGKERKGKEGERKERVTNAPKFDPLQIDLPECISNEVWKTWIDYRKARKLTCAESTLNAQIKKLEHWWHQGDDPKAVIEESISNGWQGLFELKRQNGRQAVQQIDLDAKAKADVDFIFDRLGWDDDGKPKGNEYEN